MACSAGWVLIGTTLAGRLGTHAIIQVPGVLVAANSGSHRLDGRDKPAFSPDGYTTEELDPALGRLGISFQLSCVFPRL